MVNLISNCLELKLTSSLLVRIKVWRCCADAVPGEQWPGGVPRLVHQLFSSHAPTCRRWGGEYQSTDPYRQRPTGKTYCNSKKWSYYDGECAFSGTLLLDLLTLLVQL